MKIIFITLSALIFLYNCSPVNKQHGYLIDDLILSSENISKFTPGVTTKSDIYATMGSPSIEIKDINNVWIYLISVKQKNVFEEDEITYQSVFRYEFDENGLLTEDGMQTINEFNKIAFSNEKTKVIRDAYGITDQLYDAFTRGQ